MNQQRNHSDGNERARLRWQCRRGMLELDLLLENFLDEQFAHLPEDDKQAFVALLSCHDTELQAWLLEGLPVPQVHLRHIVEQLRGWPLRRAR